MTGITKPLGSQDDALPLGGPGSGNWGHAGRKGKRGGSMPRGEAVSVKSGKDWIERYKAKSRKDHREAKEWKEQKKEPTEAEKRAAAKAEAKRKKVEAAAARAADVAERVKRVREKLTGAGGAPAAPDLPGGLSDKEVWNVSHLQMLIKARTERNIECGLDPERDGGLRRLRAQLGDTLARYGIKEIPPIAGGLSIEQARAALIAEAPAKPIKIKGATAPNKEAEGHIPPSDSVWMQIREGQQFVEQVVRVRLRDSKVMYVLNAGGRASCDQFNRIKLDRYDGTRTVVHELGHAVEHRSPSVMRATNAFLKRRTGKEKAQSLRALTGNRGYRPEEVAKPDKFPDPYCGRIYNSWGMRTRRSTEILSMGLQFLYENPVKFARQDPEYFDFVLTTVWGGN